MAGERRAPPRSRDLADGVETGLGMGMFSSKATRRSMTVVWLAGALMASACNRKPPEDHSPDSEKVREAARMVLVAKSESGAEEGRDRLHAEWSPVLNVLNSYGGPLQSSGKLDLGLRSQAISEKSLDRLTAALEKLQLRYQKAAEQTNPAEWEGQLAAMSVARVDRTLQEVRSWKGLEPKQQRQRAAALADRLRARPVMEGQSLDETPTISTIVQHR